MKVLLIQPPIRDFYDTSIRTEPIGLAYVASSLLEHGYEVEILDARTGQKKSVPIPEEFTDLRQFYPFEDRSPFKLYTGYYHFGLGFDEIEQRVAKSEAQVVGISSSFTPYHQEALEVARRIKLTDHRKIVVMGGAHVSSTPEEVLKSPWVDYVVLGEGERRFPALLEKIKRGDVRGLREIDGIGFRDSGEIVIQPPQTFVEKLDQLPYPARDLLVRDSYSIGGRRSTMIITSRGCPHGCGYCSAHLVMGKRHRGRSPEDVVKEIAFCRDRYGVGLFDIEDDNFTFDQTRARQLMELIIRTFGERVIELTAMNGISYASLDEDLLTLMERAGFRGLNLSLVSTYPETLRRTCRPGLNQSFDDILRGLEKVKLDATVYAIFGMPWQKVDEMVDTLIYLMGKRVLIGPSIFYPTPGTSVFEACRAMGILPQSETLWRSSALPLKTDKYDRLDIATLLRLARVINFVKAKIDQGELEEGMTIRDLSKFSRERSDVGQLDLPAGKAEGSASPEDLSWHDRSRAWILLLRLFFEERSFFGLKKVSAGKWVPFRVVTSRKVVDSFLDRAWKSGIFGSRIRAKRLRVLESS